MLALASANTLQLTDIQHCGVLAGRRSLQNLPSKTCSRESCDISQHSVLFHQHIQQLRQAVWGDDQGLLCNSPARYRVSLLPKHSACERLPLIYCSRTFNFFHTQTTDFNNVVCTGTGWFQTSSWLADTLSTCFKHQLLETNLVLIFETKQVETFYSTICSRIYLCDTCESPKIETNYLLWC